MLRGSGAQETTLRRGAALAALTAALGLGVLSLWLAAPASLAMVSLRLRPQRPQAPSPAAMPPIRRTVEMGEGESFSAALVRSGLSSDEASRAALALADEFDVVNPHPGLALSLAQTSGPNPGLIALSLQPRDETHLTLSRDASGAFHVLREDRPAPSLSPPATTSQLQGKVEGSLYLSMVGAGANPDTAARVASLFGRDVDLSRDVDSGDAFRLVFEQGHAPSTGGPGELVYAEVDTRHGPARLYRISAPGAAKPEYGDGTPAAETSDRLLRTPVDGAHVTSGFGMRLHPILGFTRMHQGVDFGAAVGSPVLAAADGVVEAAQWSGGYGRWLKIRHASGVETGYGHLSAWAQGIAPGASVRQGQVVAYVGASGLATGPHLHYEVFEAGQRVDPREVAAIGPARRPSQDAAVLARKAAIEAAISDLEARCAQAPASQGCGGRG